MRWTKTLTSSALLALSALCLADGPLFLAHYMPWYENSTVSGKWGWHWTMNHFSPGSGDGASHYHPLIGFYDSSDPDTVEYELLTMKAAGIKGVLVDWYGDVEVLDYGTNNRNTLLALKECEKLGMKLGLVYEDATVPQLIKASKSTPESAPGDLASLMTRLQDGMWSSPAYLKEDGHPVLLVFGPQYYKDPAWVASFANLKVKPNFYTLMNKRGTADIGSFAWPAPQKGADFSFTEMTMFNDRAKSWPLSIPVAYPRFDDIYKEAGTQPDFPKIPDNDGKTLTWTLQNALALHPAFVQLCTWNDWGEGTQLEPSRELGYASLATVSRFAKGGTKEDLKLPLQLWRWRKSGKSAALCDKAASLISQGKYAAARKLLSSEVPVL